MTNPDDKTVSPAPAKALSRPSLLGASSPAAPGATDTQGVRMLAELDASTSADNSAPARRRLMALLALGFVLAALLVWWMNRPAPDAATTPPERVAAGTPVTEAPRAVADAAPVPAPAASAASIEAVPDTGPSAAASTAPSAPVAASAAMPATTPVARIAKAAPRNNKPAGSRAAHDSDPLGTFIAQRPKNVAATRSLGAPSAGVGRTVGAHDADVDLIAALLARVSNDPGTAGPLRSNDQLTIAQIVGRCDALSRDEVLACKRRICDGYWGKADACPTRLAPGRKG